MNRYLRLASVVLTGLAVVPAAAYAQASITGVVRDTSGGVLPGVTVEASSPALIEGARAVVTDGSGQYRIVDLRPGVYEVTFTLPGFAVVRREGLQLTGSFVATVNADLRVGSLEETITVTGETPVVDVQSATRQQVMNREVMDAIPTGRTEYDLAALIPGAVNAGGTDIGGAGGRTGVPSLRVHEGRSTESRHTVSGAEVTLINDSGAAFGILLNAAATEEVVVDVAAGDAESVVGGVRLHRIPREGGNTFNGTFFATGATSAMQGNNLTQDLRIVACPHPMPSTATGTSMRGSAARFCATGSGSLARIRTGRGPCLRAACSRTATSTILTPGHTTPTPVGQSPIPSGKRMDSSASHGRPRRGTSSG